MNFKPNLLKVILSIVLGLTMGFLFNMVLSNLFPMFKPGNEPTYLIYNTTPLYFWIVNVLTIIIFYIVWSLIQKKK